MLFCSTCQIGPSGRGGSAAPDDLLAAQNGRRKNLIFQIAMVQFGGLGQPQHLACIGHRPRQRFLAGHGKHLAASGHHFVMDGAHGVHARVIGREDPDRVHIVCLHHRHKAVMALAFAKPQFGHQLDDAFPVFRLAAIDGGHVHMAYGNHGAQVKFGDEARADKADAQAFSWLCGHGCFPFSS